MLLHVVCLLDLLSHLCLLLVHLVAPQGAETGDWHQLDIFNHEPVTVAAILKIIIMQVIMNLEKAEVLLKIFFFYDGLVSKKT